MNAQVAVLEILDGDAPAGVADEGDDEIRTGFRVLDLAVRAEPLTRAALVACIGEDDASRSTLQRSIRVAQCAFAVDVADDVVSVVDRYLHGSDRNILIQIQPIASFKMIVASAAEQAILTTASVKPIGSCATGERICAVAAEQDLANGIGW